MFAYRPAIVAIFSGVLTFTILLLVHLTPSDQNASTYLQRRQVTTASPVSATTLTPAKPVINKPDSATRDTVSDPVTTGPVTPISTPDPSTIIKSVVLTKTTLVSTTVKPPTSIQTQKATSTSTIFKTETLSRPPPPPVTVTKTATLKPAPLPPPASTDEVANLATPTTTVPRPEQQSSDPSLGVLNNVAESTTSTRTSTTLTTVPASTTSRTKTPPSNTSKGSQSMTTSPHPSLQTDQTENPKPSHIGLIVGGIVAALAVACVVAAIIAFCIIHRRQKRGKQFAEASYLGQKYTIMPQNSYGAVPGGLISSARPGMQYAQGYGSVGYGSGRPIGGLSAPYTSPSHGTIFTGGPLQSPTVYYSPADIGVSQHIIATDQSPYGEGTCWGGQSGSMTSGGRGNGYRSASTPGSLSTSGSRGHERRPPNFAEYALQPPEVPVGVMNHGTF